MSSGTEGADGVAVSARACRFVVKLRDPVTRSWGNQTEVDAASAKDAAEAVAGGEHLLDGPGDRSNLRARVWETPYGSVAEQLFYAPAPVP